LNQLRGLLGWAGYVALVGKTKNAYKKFVGTPGNGRLPSFGNMIAYSL
jgi:hypothetical protein